MMLIQFAELDLTQPIEPIYVEARYQRLFLILRWGYLPLGMVFLPCQGGACNFTAEQLRHEIIQSVGWNVWEQAVAGTLDGLADHPHRQLPPISVVVCTRDRALSLKRCLAGLARLPAL